MPVPQITITPAGFAAIVNAEHTGTAPVKLTHVGLTPQHFDVATVAAILPGEAKRLTTFGGQAVSADTLHLNVRDDTADAYTLRGFGLYLQDGTLFAVYSQPAPIMEKAAAATMLLATDIRFAKVNATSIEVGDIDFVNPPATTTRAGVVRLSTDQEADTGSDPATALTPRGLAGYINRRFGNGAPSDFVKSLLGLATAALLRTELGLKSAALRDEGHGNGLNADQLDGAHGAYYLEWRNLTGVPSQFSAAPHEHPIAQVTGLTDALNGKANKSGDTFTGPVILKDALLRLSGWAGATSDGVVYFGAGNSYMLKTGASYAFNNVEGNFSATLSSGGVIWTAGNFDPSSKVSKAGDTMTGALTLSGGALRLSKTSAVITMHDDAGRAQNQPNLQLLAGLNNTTDGHAVVINRVPTGALALWGRGGECQLTVGVAESLTTLTHDFRIMDGALNVWSSGAAAINLYDRTIGDRYWSNYSTGTTLNWWLNGTGNLMYLTSAGRLTAVSFGSGSAPALKDIEGPLTYGLAEVRKVRTLFGRYKPDYMPDQSRRMFFDADNFRTVMPEAVDPEMVEYNGEWHAGILWEQVVPPMYNALSQLADLVDELRAEVAELRGGRT